MRTRILETTSPTPLAPSSIDLELVVGGWQIPGFGPLGPWGPPPRPQPNPYDGPGTGQVPRMWGGLEDLDGSFATGDAANYFGDPYNGDAAYTANGDLGGSVLAGDFFDPLSVG